MIPSNILYNIDKAKYTLENVKNIIKNEKMNKTIINSLNEILSLLLYTSEDLDLLYANFEINKNRKGSIKLKFVDNNDMPLSNKKIVYEQIDNDFLFTAQALENPKLKNYNSLNLIKDIGFNSIAYSSYFNSYYDHSNEFNFYRNFGFKIICADVFYFTDLFSRIWENLSYDDLKIKIKSTTLTKAKKLGDIKIFNIYTEPERPFTNAFHWTYNQILNVINLISKTYNDENKVTKRMIAVGTPFQFEKDKLNDYDDILVYWIETYETIKNIINAGIEFEVIAPELHYGITTDFCNSPYLDIHFFSKMIDGFLNFNKEIYIVSFVTSRVCDPQFSWWHKYTDEYIQAEYTEKCYKIMFSKKNVIGTDYFGMENFYNMTYAFLFDENYNKSPVYYTLKNLFNNWKDNGETYTNENGEITIKGFGGKYKFKLIENEKVIYEGNFHIQEQLDKEEIIKIVPTKLTIKLILDSKNIYINDIPQQIEVPPQIIEGRTYLPIRYIIEPLGGKIYWDSICKKISIIFKDKNIDLWIGKNIAKVNETNKLIDPNNPKVVPLIIQGRTMIPIRFVAENLGCKVNWDPLSKTITIIYPGV